MTDRPDALWLGGFAGRLWWTPISHSRRPTYDNPGSPVIRLCHWHRPCNESSHDGERAYGGRIMTSLEPRETGSLELVMSHVGRRGGTSWFFELATGLSAGGVGICRTYGRPETLGRIERGGLAGAIVVADDRGFDALSLLRGIRSINTDLPCWLVTREANRQTLEVALDLRVTSVLPQPVNVSAFTLTLLGALCRMD